MALPTSYLTSAKNLAAILDSIKTAQAPEKFTVRFLESLEFKTNADRLIIGVLKSLGFLADDGRPTQRYFDFLDQTQSDAILAQAVREAYADLFAVNIHADQLSRDEVKNKFKTLSQGQYSESVLDKMASTFTALVSLADFKSTRSTPPPPIKPETPSTEPKLDDKPKDPLPNNTAGFQVSGLVYNIQLVLPESRDPAVYDAFFTSLRKHLG
jgi:hypothetical protein